MTELALDIGSGEKGVKETGWLAPGDIPCKVVSLDLYANADVVWDFSNTPYPFPDDHFLFVFARHTLEHVRRDKLVDVMKEIHRITHDRGVVYIRVPYWNSEGFAGDPTHWNPFCETTFRHFAYGGSMGTSFYIPPLFQVNEIAFRFHPKLRLLPKRLLKELMHVMNGICDELWVELRVIKHNPYPAYNPKRTYSFNLGEGGTWKAALFYATCFYGAAVVSVLSILRWFI